LTRGFDGAVRAVGVRDDGEGVVHQLVVRETFGQIAELLGEGRGARVEVDEDEEAPALCLDGQQAVVGFIEIPDLAHVEGGPGFLGDVRASNSGVPRHLPSRS
jgi:hypothetical protein